MFGLQRLACSALTLLALGSMTSAAEPVAFDIPRIDAVNVDGDPADWAESGMKINVLSSIGERPPIGDLDARARLGWNENALLLLLQVSDDTADEAGTLDTAWMHDSIELFIADKVGGSRAAQFVLSPGLSSDQPKLRTKSIDKRGTAAGKPLEWQSAVRKTDDGYVVEIAIPWSNLGLTAKTGLEAAIQFYVTDSDRGTPRKRLLWHPQEGANTSTTRMNTIRLAEIPSRPVEYVVSINDVALRGLRLSFAARGQFASRTLKVFRGQTEIVSADTTQTGTLTSATARLPLPALGTDAGTYRIEFGGTIQADIPSPNLDKARLTAFDRLQLRPSAYVFTGNAFPAIDFDNIERAEILVGSYRITARFFDAAMNEVAKPALFGRYGAVLQIDIPGQATRYRYVTLCRAKKEIDPDAWRPRVDLPLESIRDFGSPVMPAESEEVSDSARSAILESMRRNESQAVLFSALYDQSGTTDNIDIQDSKWWFELRQRIGQPYNYRYLEFIPKTASTQKYPAILFLHGSGERGDDLSRLENNGPRAYAKATADFPFILISLQCPWGEWWNPVAVDALAKELLAKYPIDPDRFYLTGLSLGGYGTWATGSFAPDRFAALAPICGGGNVRTVVALANTPVWAVHGGKDTSVRPSKTFQLVQALREQRGRVRFTFYPELGHDTWTPTYNDPRLYAWFLQQRRNHPAEPQATEATTQPTEVR